jgi:uncharacterized membrane protein
MSETRETTRIEAFSDGVFAIAITLLVLEIKIPQRAETPAVLWQELWKLWPSYFGFLFSFGSILITWVNHHVVFNHIERKSNAFIYANGFLLLIVSFIPFPTALLAEYITADSHSTAITYYCGYSLLSNISWILLFYTVRHPVNILTAHGQKLIAERFDRLKYFGFSLYAVTFILSFWFSYTALLINVALWILWIVTSLAEKK